MCSRELIHIVVSSTRASATRGCAVYDWHADATSYSVPLSDKIKGLVRTACCLASELPHDTSAYLRCRKVDNRGHSVPVCMKYRRILHLTLGSMVPAKWRRHRRNRNSGLL